MSEQVKVVLTDEEMPRQWYNIQADLAKPMPPPLDMHGNPIGPDTLAPGVSFDDLLAPATDVAVGSDGLIYLPYLTGERTPYPDPLARTGMGQVPRCSTPDRPYPTPQHRRDRGLHRDQPRFDECQESH